MPWDCDKYFKFDPQRDSALWPISPVLHGPVAIAALIVCALVGALVLGL